MSDFRSRLRNWTICGVAFLAVGPPIAGAGLFTYEDDFQSVKIPADSYSHSSIVLPGDPYIDGHAILIYQRLGSGNITLWFSRNLDKGADPYLEYKAIPPATIATAGSIEWDWRFATLPVKVSISGDGTDWKQLTISSATDPHGVFPIPPGSAA